MADMELDLDVPTKAPARPATTKFLPRASKPLPKPKLKPEPVSTQIQPKMEFEAKPPLQIKRDENADIGFSTTENDVVGIEMDIDIDIEAYVDEVVNEIDVYFSPSIDDNTKLHVWQYPLRPLWRPYELDDRCKEVRMKPDSGEVEIDLAIDDGGWNYDHNDHKPADTIKITKQTLSSSWNPPARTAYAIGVLAGNELHLSPVDAVVQLRPSLEHLKPGGPVKKNAGGSKGECIVKVEQLKEVRLPVSAKQWLPLHYFGHESNISASCLHKMLKKEDATIHFLMSSHDYVDSLCPGTSNNNVKDKVHFIRSLRSLPLDERFQGWFRKGDAISRFDTLKHLAMEESDEEILSVILKYAQLVQGNWVAKSSLVFGTRHEVLCRDHVLAQFRKNLVLSELPQILSVLARPSGKGWKFATPRDMTFLKLYPHIEEQQEATWKDLEEQINNGLKGGKRKVVWPKNWRVLK